MSKRQVRFSPKVLATRVYPDLPRLNVDIEFDTSDGKVQISKVYGYRSSDLLDFLHKAEGLTIAYVLGSERVDETRPDLRDRRSKSLRSTPSRNKMILDDWVVLDENAGSKTTRPSFSPYEYVLGRPDTLNEAILVR